MSADQTIRVGDSARTASDLRPGGIITVDGVRHSARSRGVWIEPGTEVIIVGGDNYGFTVVPTSDLPSREDLANYGTLVTSNFGGKVKVEAEEAERREREWRRNRERWIRRVGPFIGVIAGSVGVWRAWPLINESYESPQLWGITGGIVLLGGLLGFVLLWLIDHCYRYVEYDLHQVSLPSLCLFLVGFIPSLNWALPKYEWPMATLIGVSGGILISIPLALFALLMILRGGGDASLKT